MLRSRTLVREDVYGSLDLTDWPIGNGLRGNQPSQTELHYLDAGLSTGDQHALATYKFELAVGARFVGNNFRHAISSVVGATNERNASP